MEISVVGSGAAALDTPWAVEECAVLLWSHPKLRSQICRQTPDYHITGAEPRTVKGCEFPHLR